MFSSLTFKYLVAFEFIFVSDVRKWFNSILLHIVAQFFQHHLLKRLCFPHCIALPPLSWIHWPGTCEVVVFFSGLSIVFINTSVFVPVPYCFYYDGFITYLENLDWDTSSSIFIYQDCFLSIWSYIVPYKF